MDIEQLEKLFESFDDEYSDFDLIENKRSRRKDLHAFLLLDELFPSNKKMVAAAEHDEIYLDIDPERLAKVATPDQIKELVRCGVRYGEDGLCMFV